MHVQLTSTFFCSLDSNILVQQNCHCSSPLRCSCPGPGGIDYVLSDMDLLCMDGQSVSGKYVEWTETKLHEPAGTYGMKASEVNCEVKVEFCV